MSIKIPNRLKKFIKPVVKVIWETLKNIFNIIHDYIYAYFVSMVIALLLVPILCYPFALNGNKPFINTLFIKDFLKLASTAMDVSILWFISGAEIIAFIWGSSSRNKDIRVFLKRISFPLFAIIFMYIFYYTLGVFSMNPSSKKFANRFVILVTFLVPLLIVIIDIVIRKIFNRLKDFIINIWDWINDKNDTPHYNPKKMEFLWTVLVSIAGGIWAVFKFFD